MVESIERPRIIVRGLRRACTAQYGLSGQNNALRILPINELYLPRI